MLTGIGAAGLSAVGSLLGNWATGNFNANQANINREWQEKMYKQQLADMRENWDRQNQYDLPSAQVQRLRDANLNPYLMYSNGASGLTSQGSIGNPSQPHGAQASANFGNIFADAMQSPLIQAEVAKKQAETEKIRSEIDWQKIENQFSKDTYDIRRAIKYNDYDLMSTTMEKMRTEMYNSSQIRLQQVLSMIQGREYEIKRFNLDKWSIGESIEQGWKDVLSHRISANAQMRSAFAAVMQAKNAWRIGTATIGQIALNMSQSREMFPLLKEGARQDNLNKFWNRVWQGVQIDNAKKQGFEQDLNNYFKSHGVGPDTWFYKVASPFVLPTIHLNDKWFSDDVPERMDYVTKRSRTYYGD